MSNVD